MFFAQIVFKYLVEILGTNSEEKSVEKKGEGEPGDKVFADETEGSSAANESQDMSTRSSQSGNEQRYFCLFIADFCTITI